MKCTNSNCESGLVKKLGSTVVLVPRTMCAYQYPGTWQGSTTLKENHNLLTSLCLIHVHHMGPKSTVLQYNLINFNGI